MACSHGTAVVAHRGDVQHGPENSMPAFRAAREADFAMVELDVHVTRDGELAVIHDPTLERTATGRGAIMDLSWSEVSQARLRDAEDERVPRLADVLALYRPARTKLIVEAKARANGTPYPDLPRLLLAALEQHGMLARCRVSAFDWSVLEALRALSPSLALVGVMDGKRPLDSPALARAMERLLAMRATDMGLEWTMVDVTTVTAAHCAGLEIGAWTVNRSEEHRLLAGLGVDWLITDRPQVAREALIREAT